MCFEIDKENPEEKVAEEDIPVIKYYKRTYLDKNTYVSPYMGFRVEKGKTYKEPLFGLIEKMSFPDGGAFVINKGFHSYSEDIDRATEDAFYGNLMFCSPVKCIIPKGTRYYYSNHTKEYVSEKILIGEMTSYGLTEEQIALFDKV